MKSYCWFLSEPYTISEKNYFFESQNKNNISKIILSLVITKIEEKNFFHCFILFFRTVCDSAIKRVIDLVCVQVWI